MLDSPTDPMNSREFFSRPLEDHEAIAWTIWVSNADAEIVSGQRNFSNYDTAREALLNAQEALAICGVYPAFSLRPTIVSRT